MLSRPSQPGRAENADRHENHYHEKLYSGLTERHAVQMLQFFQMFFFFSSCLFLQRNLPHNCASLLLTVGNGQFANTVRRDLQRQQTSNNKINLNLKYLEKGVNEMIKMQ